MNLVTLLSFITDLGERQSTFDLGAEFVHPWGKDAGFMHTVCTMADVNVLRYEIFFPELESAVELIDLNN